MSEQQTVAQLLETYRLAAGWPTLRQIAASAGLSTASCGNILSGKHHSSLASVEKITAALHGDVAAARECWLHPGSPPELLFDAETRVMEGLVQGFEQLSAGARVRVIRYLISRFGIRLDE